MVGQSSQLKGIKDHRNKFFAHNLDTIPAVTAKYGFENTVLRASQRIAASITAILRDRALTIPTAVGSTESMPQSSSKDCLGASRLLERMKISRRNTFLFGEE